jgi:hypothetical protein
MPQKGLIDPHLEAVLRKFTKAKKESYPKRTTNDAVPWFRPPLEGWDGDLQTEEGLITIHDAFNTDKAETALIEAYQSKSPGNVSDGIVLSLQIDYAAQAERAFRARTTQTFPRALAHLSTREKGHGQDTGAFTGQALNYFTALIKQGAEGTGGAV